MKYCFEVCERGELTVVFYSRQSKVYINRTYEETNPEHDSILLRVFRRVKELRGQPIIRHKTNHTQTFRKRSSRALVT